LTNIGRVTDVKILHNQLIVTLDVFAPYEIRLCVDDQVTFKEFGQIRLAGLKYWRENRTLDLLIDGTKGTPAVGDVAMVEDGDMTSDEVDKND